MFNQGGFNMLHFNRALIIEIYGNFNLNLVNQLSGFEGTLEIVEGFEINTELEPSFNGIVDKLSFFILNQKLDSEFTVTREMKHNFVINTNLNLTFEGNRVLINAISFIGNFAPGQKIIIDMDKFTVTLDGQNALHLVEGDFFNLTPGTNDLIFEDIGSNRQVKIQVEYRDRWL